MKLTVLLPLVTSTIPGAWSCLRWYSAGLIRPSLLCPYWSAIATMPANSGIVLVGDRDDAGELRRRRAGPPAGAPGSRRAGKRLEENYARGAERDVRDAAVVPGDPADRVLVGGAGEDRRQAPSAGQRERCDPQVPQRRGVVAVVPGGVGRGPAAGRVQVQCGAADAGDERVRRGPFDDPVMVEGARGGGARDAEIVGGGQHGDMVPAGVDVGVAQPADGGPAREGREVLLREGEALADDIAEVTGDHVILGRHELREAAAGDRLGRGGLDQEDVRPRGDLMGQLNVAGRLSGFVPHLGVLRVVGRHLAHGLQYPECRRGREAEGAVEGRQVVTDGR